MPSHLAIIRASAPRRDRHAAARVEALADSLAEGLLAVAPDLTISLLLPAGTAPPPRVALDRWGPRVRLVWFRPTAWRPGGAGWDHLSRAVPAWRRWVVHAANRGVESLLWGNEATRWSGRRALALRALAAVLAVGLFPLAWLGAGVNQLLFSFLLPVLGLPLRGWQRLRAESGQLPSLASRLNELDGTAWVQPALDGDTSVLEIHGGDALYLVPVPPALSGPERQRGQTALALGPRPQPFSGRGNPAHCSPPGSRYLLMPAAQLWPHADLYADALQQLSRDSGEPLEVVCLGRCPPAFKERMGTVSFRFLGHVPPADRASLYGGALLMLFPEQPDPDVRAVLAALTHGCPVVCPDRPAYRQLLADCPESVLYFDPEDAGSIARAVRRTLNQREMFRRAQQQAYRDLARRDGTALARAVLAAVEQGSEEDAAHAA